MTAAGAVPAPDGAEGGLGIATEWRGRWRVLVVVGELDMATAPALNDHLSLTLVVDCPPRVALELSGVRFCDSSGVNAFVRGWKRASALDGELVLVAPPPRVADYLKMTGVRPGHHRRRRCTRMTAPTPTGRRSRERWGGHARDPSALFADMAGSARAVDPCRAAVFAQAAALHHLHLHSRLGDREGRDDGVLTERADDAVDDLAIEVNDHGPAVTAEADMFGAGMQSAFGGGAGADREAPWRSPPDSGEPLDAKAIMWCRAPGGGHPRS